MSNKIMVLTLSFGSGHIRAAQAVVSELHRQQPDAEIRMIDALENCSLVFRVFYIWTYWAMIRYAPQLWNKFFHARIERKDKQTAPVWAWLRGCSEVFKEIKIFQPDLIVACEVGASEIAVIAHRENLTNAEIINVITDFEAEPIWRKPEISVYCVASKDVKNQLQNWGVNAEKIKVCGIPIDENFSRRHNANRTKLRFGLDDRPIVLLMGGGMGPTRMDEVAALLLKNGKNLQIVALAGHDHKTYFRLKKLPNTETVKLCVLNWTSQVANLMQTASILATKPGGLTLSEAAVCGLPIILFDTIPGPEEINAKRFMDGGAAILTRGSKETASEILRLLENEIERQKMSVNIEKFAQPDATKKIVEIVLEKLSDKAINQKVQTFKPQQTHYPSSSKIWRKIIRNKRLFEKIANILFVEKPLENIKPTTRSAKTK